MVGPRAGGCNTAKSCANVKSSSNQGGPLCAWAGAAGEKHVYLCVAPCLPWIGCSPACVLAAAYATVSVLVWDGIYFGITMQLTIELYTTGIFHRLVIIHNVTPYIRGMSLWLLPMTQSELSSPTTSAIIAQTMLHKK